jgi:hypothetical protein
MKRRRKKKMEKRWDVELSEPFRPDVILQFEIISNGRPEFPIIFMS